MCINGRKYGKLKAPDEKILFTNLVKENMKRAYFSALAIVANHDDAMELSQQAFLQAYKNFGKFDRQRKFFTWYYKILRNLCLNFIRDKKNRRESVYDEGVLIKLEFDIHEDIEKEEDLEKLQRAMSELENPDREIIALKEFEGFSYKEIAEMLEMPIGSVMSKLYYARKKLAGNIRL